MFPPPLLSSRPPALQVMIAVVTPILFGALCGVMLGVHEGVYLLLAVPIATIGGFVAGIEHPNGHEGALRGMLGGLQFGSALVIAHEISGLDAKADLPHPAILLVVVTTTLGSVLGYFGGRLRGRLERRGATSG